MEPGQWVEVDADLKAWKTETHDHCWKMANATPAAADASREAQYAPAKRASVVLDSTSADAWSGGRTLGVPGNLSDLTSV